MTLNRTGRNRWVVLTRLYAVKVPSPIRWRDFLFGLLNNMREAETSHLPGRCPVIAKVPLGLAIVMPRVQIMSSGEFAAFDAAAFCKMHGISAEHKPDSFGRLCGEIVAVDYGWP